MPCRAVSPIRFFDPILNNALALRASQNFLKSLSKFYQKFANFAERRTRSRWRDLVPGVELRRARVPLHVPEAAVVRDFPGGEEDVGLGGRSEWFDRRGIEPFELFTSQFGQNSDPPVGGFPLRGAFQKKKNMSNFNAFC